MIAACCDNECDRYSACSLSYVTLSSSISIEIEWSNKKNTTNDSSLLGLIQLLTFQSYNFAGKSFTAYWGEQWFFPKKEGMINLT